MITYKTTSTKNISDNITDKLKELSFGFEGEMYPELISIKSNDENIPIIFAYNDDKIIGWSMAMRFENINSKNNSYGIYIGVFVNPNYRRKGIGTNLIKLLSNLVKKDTDYIVVRPHDKTSYAFYKKHGSWSFGEPLDFRQFGGGIYKQRAIPIKENILKELPLSEIKKLYHVTPSYNISSIKSAGLLPKAENKLTTHEKAIYFVTSEIDAWNMSFQLNKFLAKNKKIKYATDFTILKINLQCLPKNIKFYEDPNSIRERGLFTFEKISPSCVEIYDEIKSYQLLRKNYSKEYLKKFYPTDYEYRYKKKLSNKTGLDEIVKDDTYNKLLQLSLIFRKEMEDYYENKSCMKGICQDITKNLVNFLNKNGFNAKRVGGYYKNVGDEFISSDGEFSDDNTWKHWWVEVNGKYIVDITADQFHPGEEKDYRVVITNINDPDYN